MKNTLSLIGAIVVGIGIMVASAVIVKKFVDKKSDKKCCDEDFDNCDCDFCDDDFNWEDIPVEEDEEDIVAESIKELDDLDTEEK